MKNGKKIPDKRIHFIGILSNVDKSILQVKLDHGFTIDAFSSEEGMRFFFELERISGDFPGFNVLNEIFTDHGCLNYSEGRLYTVRNSFLFAPDPDPLSYSGHLRAESEFHRRMVQSYLNIVLRLMRLFMEGDIRLPFTYYYLMENGKLRPFGKWFSYRSVSREPYQLAGSELQELDVFIHSTKIPFQEPFLQLAFENLELSYDIDDIRLSFLTLMVSLETLLNPGKYELTYSISRNTAVLLGEDRNGSESIFREVKELYKRRSEIVHSGKSDRLTKADLLRLRYYVRESIKQVYRIGKSKDEICDLLNSHGFGERI